MNAFKTTGDDTSARSSGERSPLLGLPAFLLRLIFLLGGLGILWYPHVAPFLIVRSVPSDEVVAGATRHPTDPLLAEVSDMRLGVPVAPGVSRSAVAAAEEILEDHLTIPNLLSQPMKLSGYPEDFKKGPPTARLIMASLAAEDILLSAYEQSNDPRYLAVAVRRLLSFARYDRFRYLPEGFLWNDHALAARASVLVRGWMHLRTSNSYGVEDRRELLALVQRTGRHLAKPAAFTVRTNHGVMQNIALLQLAAAFPGLTESVHWRDVALDRLLLQLGFYVSDEGMVLEHSPEYHALGVELLAMAVRLARLAGAEPPEALVSAAERSADVLSVIIRPDGSLPLIGNSAGARAHNITRAPMSGKVPIVVQPPKTSASASSQLFPLSGYAVWWAGSGSDKSRSQTVVAWANHPRHGHKHADEGTLTFWSRGTDWVTDTGYWPYGFPGYREANGWEGSNAPHMLGEGAKGDRTAKLIAYYDSSDARFLHLQRTNNTGEKFDRQVLQIAQNDLLVLDFAIGVTEPVETIWTFAPSLTAQRTPTGAWRMGNSEAEHQLGFYHHSISPYTEQLYLGSTRPFAGWVVLGRQPVRAPAVRMLHDGPSTASVTAFSVRGHKQPADDGQLTLEQGATPTQWVVTWITDVLHYRLERRGQAIQVASLGPNMGGGVTINLRSPDNHSERESLLRTAMQESLATYPPWRSLGSARNKLSLIMVAAFLFSEIMWLAIARRIQISPSAAVSLHAVLLIGWLSLAIAINTLYLS